MAIINIVISAGGGISKAEITVAVAVIGAIATIAAAYIIARPKNPNN